MKEVKPTNNRQEVWVIYSMILFKWKTKNQVNEKPIRKQEAIRNVEMKWFFFELIKNIYLCMVTYTQYMHIKLLWSL